MKYTNNASGLNYRDIKNGYLSVEVVTDGCLGSPTAVRFLEHVQSVLTIKAMHRGAIVVKVTSPMRTTSVMLHERGLDSSNQGFTDWPFMSVQFWGENPTGTWRIEILDTSMNSPFISPQNSAAANSALISWSLVFFGTASDPISKDIKDLLEPEHNNIAMYQTSGASKSALLPDPNFAQQTANHCHLSCQTCRGPHMDECNSCYKSYYLHNAHCLVSCPQGFYPVNNTMTCKSCPPKCTKCSSDGVCMMCQTGYLLGKGGCSPVHSAVDDECLHGTMSSGTPRFPHFLLTLCLLTFRLLF